MKKKNSGNHIGFGADIFCDGRSSGICRRQAVGNSMEADGVKDDISQKPDRNERW